MTAENREEQEVSEQEVTQYDRQIRLWGLDGQKRLRNSKICVIGLSSLGSEIVKNLTLAGVGEMVLMDDRKVDEKTLLMTRDGGNFFRANFGTAFENRASASLDRVQELNPNVKVFIAPGFTSDKNLDFFKNFSLVVIAVILPKDELLRITGILREGGIKHIVGATFGMYGFGFNDFLEHEYSLTKNEKTELRKISFKPLSEAINYSENEVTFPKRYKKNKVRVALNLYEAYISEDFKAKFAEFESLKGIEDWGEEFEGDIPPIGAIVGGLMGQEAIKAIGQKERPIYNTLLFDGDRMDAKELLLPRGDPKEI
ncbi:Oidioi.mRNA.OKI2018_I69.PAR.g11514.t1.cds [Oikopleura dioica]|uniref:Oidioi.mRNA.OKI2018_I69.PAR.g11514.t1.cds n=1 Tax=Oikopleura dioica TaxID=34765 RepID=A0ABN7S0P7_OIKDI|nr:Oidioi.mRNA.OKI2018_I69.PAR.g11514.t1.cds [Oikopleura dioica]